jgi:hypothetical protein
MESVLSSRYAGAKVRGGSLRAYPRRRRRRSICPISAGTRPGSAPSAAYPLSPRRREIVPLPPRHRAGADVHVNAQPSIRDRPLGTNVARKKVCEGCHHSNCRRSTMGWSPGGRTGSSFEVVTSTDSPARQNLGSQNLSSHGFVTRLDSGDHLAAVAAALAAPGSGPARSRR